MSLHPSEQPKTPFHEFYAAPTPMRALNLAIADAYAAKMPHEYTEQLVALRDAALAQHDALRQLSDFTHLVLLDDNNGLSGTTTIGLDQRTFKARAALARFPAETS